MAFARLQTLFPLILPKAPGCPGVTAAQQARLAAIEFCERSRCWREITTVTVDAAGEAALVAPPEQAGQRHAVDGTGVGGFRGVAIEMGIQPEQADRPGRGAGGKQQPGFVAVAGGDGRVGQSGTKPRG